MPNPFRVIRVLSAGLLVLGLAFSLWSQEETPTPDKKRSHSWLAMRLSEQDVLLPITSVEWGAPDRWSVTSRYIHEFDKDRGYLPWRNNFTVSLSPGTDGGRFGIGYEGIFTPLGNPDAGFFAEARVVLLRTWGNPLETKPNRTFVGAEIRGALSLFCNVGVGYYRQISSHEGPADAFWGLHVGFGI